jgi:transposase
MQVTTIGLDIAKNVFQVHGIDATEKVVVRKQLRCGQLIKFFEALAPCLIGMEGCATADAVPTAYLHGVRRDIPQSRRHRR